MWSNFFHDGGWGMYPTAFSGFFLVLASVLVLIRPDRKFVPLLASLGAVTLLSGVLGTLVGVANSMRFIHQVPVERQLGILSMGVAESLNVTVLALILVVLASLLGSGAALRHSRSAGAAG